MTHSLNPKSSRDRYELMLRGYKVETLKSMLGLDPSPDYRAHPKK